MKRRTRQWLWFVGLWLAGLVVVAGAAYGLRGLLTLLLY
ncbi:DUF2474 domain-containing protein [Salinisphaera sp. PC39]